MNTTQPIRRGIIVAAIGLAAVTGAIAGAGLARATPTQDAQYLALITDPAPGFTPLVFGSADIAIAEGKAVCDVLDDGQTLGQAIADVDAVLPVNRDGALTVVSAAVVVFCPWHMPASAAAI